MNLQINKIKSTRKKLEIYWEDGSSTDFHALWLRDNCRCDDCGIPETGRRKSRLSELPLDITMSSVKLVDGNDSIVIKWSDSHESLYSVSWLNKYAYEKHNLEERVFAPCLWNDELRKNPPTLDFNDVDSDDSQFLQMLELIQNYGLCLLSSAGSTPGKLEAFANKIGPIQESNFGRVQDLIIDETKSSVANRAVALKPHTDEPYRASPPGILLFHCIETDVNGTGSSTFMDGFELAEIVKAEDPAGFVALTQNRQPFRRHFHDEVDLAAEFPVISVDELNNICGIRINDRVAAPLSIPSEEIEDYYRGLKRLLELAEDPDRMLLLTLRPGDVAIFDNHRILHGRTEITMNSRRWLQWLQVERGDFYSTINIFTDRLGLTRKTFKQLRGAY